MTIQEFYQAIDGSYENVMLRFHSEETVLKLLKIFRDDKSFEQLQSAMIRGDVKNAFLQAHTLKGVALNMELGRLTESAIDVTERLRTGDLEGGRFFFEKLASIYERTMKLLDSVEGVS